MTYELAKELKDAGFHQNPDANDDDYFIAEELQFPTGGKYNEVIYIPTLSELIEACGEDFYSLYRHSTEWQAHSNSDQWDTEISHGGTPEEAVARLWLALNKKV